MISSFVSAQSYSYTFAKGDITGEGDATLGGITWNVSGTWNATAWFGWDTSTYAKGIQLGSSKNSAKAITIKTNGIAGTITSVVVNAATASGGTATLDVTVGGTSTGAQDLSLTSTDYTFEPNAAGELAIVFTQPSTLKALYIKSISVTYSATGNFVAAPTIDGATPFVGSTTVTLSAETGASIYYTTDGTDPTNASTLYAAPFQLTKTTTVKAIAYKDGTASAVVSKDFTAAYQASDIADFKAQADKTDQVLTLTNAQVIYADASNTNVYVRDNTGAICFYKAGLGVATGDVLNGTVAGTLSIYNNLPEFVANTATNADNITKTAGAAIDPVSVTVTAAQAPQYLCNLVQISGVKLDSVGNKLFAYQDGDSIQVYDQIKTLTGQTVVTPSENNTVTGILVVYKTTYEIYPITVDGIVTTAIADLKAEADDVNAPTFNLAGQRVGADYKGVVIRNGKKFIRR